MNCIFITGNLTRDPELRSTPSGTPVCNFSVAVNPENKKAPNAQTQFMQVTAWNTLAEVCSKFLAKGRKVAVMGEATCRAYTKKDGTTECTICVNASKIEFLSSRNEDAEIGMPSAAGDAAPVDDGGYVRVDPGEDLPWF